MKKVAFMLAFFFAGFLYSQTMMTPELLWQVKRVSPLGISADEKDIFYTVTIPNIEEDSFDKKYYKTPITGGKFMEVQEDDVDVPNKNLSTDGRYLLLHKPVHVNDVMGKDIYKDLEKSDGYVFTSLDYRHWDSFNDGNFNHVFYKDVKSGAETDITPQQPYYTPQAPFGGDEDYIWGPKGENIYYVSKKLAGTEYATSTNTDIYRYNLETRRTENITADNKGYDTKHS